MEQMGSKGVRVVKVCEACLQKFEKELKSFYFYTKLSKCLWSFSPLFSPLYVFSQTCSRVLCRSYFFSSPASRGFLSIEFELRNI